MLLDGVKAGNARRDEASKAGGTCVRVTPLCVQRRPWDDSHWLLDALGVRISWLDYGGHKRCTVRNLGRVASKKRRQGQ